MPNMFKMFKKKSSTEETSVPYIEPPKKEEPATIYYRFGLTDNNRVAFSMGYSEITMNRAGAQQMIDQLTFYMNQIQEEGKEDADA